MLTDVVFVTVTALQRDNDAGLECRHPTGGVRQIRAHMTADDFRWQESKPPGMGPRPIQWIVVVATPHSVAVAQDAIVRASPTGCAGFNLEGRMCGAQPSHQLIHPIDRVTGIGLMCQTIVVPFEVANGVFA